MSGHTPGPWVVETVPTSVGTCHKIGPFPSNSRTRTPTYACVYAHYIRESDYGHSKVGDELMANALLMTAAPELLESARAGAEYRNALNECANNPSRMASFCTAQGDDLDTLFDRWERLSNAAIAKAEGVQP